MDYYQYYIIGTQTTFTNTHTKLEHFLCIYRLNVFFGNCRLYLRSDLSLSGGWVGGGCCFL